LGDQIKKSKAGNVAHTGNRRGSYKTDLQERDHLKNLGIDGRLTFKMDLE
jgi:hypothetical protein